MRPTVPLPLALVLCLLVCGCPPGDTGRVAPPEPPLDDDDIGPDDDDTGPDDDDTGLDDDDIAGGVMQTRWS